MLNYVFPVVGKATPFIDIALATVLAVLLIVFAVKQKLSNKVILALVGAVVSFIVSKIFDFTVLTGVTYVYIALLTVYAALLLTKPEKETELKKNKKVSKKQNSLTTNETDELFENLQKAITTLSLTQTGALITIERTDDLTYLMQKNGTKVNAPVTPELLGTIFYKGTPLHDGATVIRGNMIVASSVFYQPTQKPLNGKYGSRHRAAIGISEVCDALTIIVSEETGKVAFAYKGELITVPVIQFAAKLKEYYFLSEKE